MQGQGWKVIDIYVWKKFPLSHQGHPRAHDHDLCLVSTTLQLAVGLCSKSLLFIFWYWVNKVVNLFFGPKLLLDDPWTLMKIHCNDSELLEFINDDLVHLVTHLCWWTPPLFLVAEGLLVFLRDSSLWHFFEWPTQLSPLLSKTSQLSSLLSKSARLSTFLSAQKNRYTLKNTF